MWTAFWKKSFWSGMFWPPDVSDDGGAVWPIVCETSLSGPVYRHLLDLQALEQHALTGPDFNHTIQHDCEEE